MRLKTDIQRVGSQDGVNIYTWNWNDEGKEIAGDQPQIGVLAQEIQQTNPDAVVKGEDGYLRVDYNKVFGGN